MSYNLAVLGSTGAVGKEILDLLEERKFPINHLKLLASKRSAGKKINFRGRQIIVEELTHQSFVDVDIVLSSASGSISREFLPSAVKAGALCIDNTSYFRLHPEVPLVIPEINVEEIIRHQGIIANPNCSTIIMLVPLWFLHQINPIKRVIVSTYQAASGAGAAAIDELKRETKALLNGKSFKREVMPHPYAFNLFPHNSPMNKNGYCEEENKMINETRKIFKDPTFKVSPTCVRVPVLRAHSESINIEFTQPTSEEEIYRILSSSPGVKVLENRNENRWPMPVDASQKDLIYVGRVRRDLTNPNTYEIWVVGDQIRKGAALNAIQIAEKYIEKK